jgi:tetratricopeptide (TPR) repeat protein
MRKRTKLPLIIIAGLVVLILVGVGLSFVPKIHSAIAWRWDNLTTTIYYYIHPPEDVIFVPSQQALLTQVTDMPITIPSATTTPTLIESVATTTPVPPTVTVTPIPASVVLDNITFINQNARWNYCGPANLTMALKYFGWTGSMFDIGDVVKPGINDPNMTPEEATITDVNVMPYEMVDYVNDYTPYKALYRYGGDMDLLKQLIAAGFPVIVEKAVHEQLAPEWTLQWAGHFAFTTGYDDNQKQFVWQDSLITDQEPIGKNKRISYTDFYQGWRAFDFVFIIVYPPERENQLFQLLGNWTNDTWAVQNALNTNLQDSPGLTGIDALFNLFDTGTSYGLLGDYGDAALAYDQFFQLYEAMPSNDRPYRIFYWYQTGALRAYFYTGRYQDVINLANKHLESLKAPRSLEESLYYRALAEAELGLYDSAYADMRQAVYYRKNFQLAIQKLADWGISP